MSYTTLSKQTGISRTGISHHFPKKQDFATALDGRIFRLFVEKLDLDNGLAGFSTSWIAALNDEKFKATLRLLFHHIASSETTSEFAKRGIDRLYGLCLERFGEESQKELEWLLGKSLISLVR